MKILKGTDESSNPIIEDAKEHKFSDLPMKGLGKSFDSVGILEPVIFARSEIINKIIADYTKAEIERRADELGAEINQMELPSRKNEANPSISEPYYQIWFSPKKESE